MTEAGCLGQDQGANRNSFLQARINAGIQEPSQNQTTSVINKKLEDYKVTFPG